MRQNNTLRDQVVQHLVIYQPVDRKKYEDFASNEATLKLFDKTVAPRSFVLSAMLLLVRRFSSICVQLVNITERFRLRKRTVKLTHSTLVDKTNPTGSESIDNDSTLWRPDNVVLLPGNQYNNTHAEHEQTEQECSPETSMLFHLGSCD